VKSPQLIAGFAGAQALLSAGVGTLAALVTAFAADFFAFLARGTVLIALFLYVAV
jgi:hypothetical protein